jgi:hypothetical protein
VLPHMPSLVLEVEDTEDTENTDNGTLQTQVATPTSPTLLKVMQQCPGLEASSAEVELPVMDEESPRPYVVNRTVQRKAVQRTSSQLTQVELQSVARSGLARPTAEHESQHSDTHSCHEDDVAKESTAACVLSVLNQLATPSMVALLLGAFVGLIPPLQHFFFVGAARTVGSTFKALGQPAALASSLVMAAWLAHSRAHTNEESLEVPSCVLWSALFTKVMILPGIGVGLFCLLNQFDDDNAFVSAIFPQDPLVRLVTLVEFAVPPALTIILTTTQLGFVRQTLMLSHLLFFLYLSSVISMAIVITIGLIMVKE